MVKLLVDYLYMDDDGYDQAHKEFCVKCFMVIILISVPTILICGF